MPMPMDTGREDYSNRKTDGMGRIGAEKRSPKKVEFKPPAGAKLEGDSGEAEVSWERKPNGMVCLTEFAGAPMPGYEGQEESPEHEAQESPDEEATEDNAGGEGAEPGAEA